MRIEFILKVKPGDVLAKSIFSSDGKILLRAGVSLTLNYINRLKQLDVLYVYIEDKRLSDLDLEDIRLNELKIDTLKGMSSIVKKITLNDRVDIMNSLIKVEELMNYIIEFGDVNKSLNDIKTHDNYTFVHSIDTGIMAAFLGINMAFKRSDIINLGIAATLHDMGKVKISKDILNKSQGLSNIEYLEIKKHPIYGADILRSNTDLSVKVTDAILQHHERVDGTGYPFGLKGNDICLNAKIISVCDVYDAVSNDRSYRTKFNPKDSYELILAGSGKFFDEEVVKVFKETFAVYPLGSCLKLSDGVEGYVIKQNKGFPDRPVIRVLYHGEDKTPIKFYEVNLLEHINLSVECVY
ncbi:HD-GYP domain-containing protein [Clostridium algidicarnis]|uniref:HD-GYP domain-containing protein n=1 Tax=Clostridium algidicarnis TaxID=37659 RepID=UPI001C0D12EC|nr:HD-GYP domain-containing protein [Clostridium algidicarnis]MBU3196162.1 HD-GYP domain-containing protein [Clostridium algidicarnis]MBU3209204.1 HD-GYP domain-containing protein [Clostridium algidicarnis]MBU3228853.1 HD-GYP domain-containing protein [Clostridium algidicarnis]MBU3252429.1 HD-GYP domain-containing protein [Clostridium algidicarnis]